MSVVHEYESHVPSHPKIKDDSLNGKIMEAIVNNNPKYLRSLCRKCECSVLSNLDFLSEAVKNTKDGRTVDVLLDCGCAKSRQGVEPYAITCVRSNPRVATIEALAKHNVSINVSSFNGTPVVVEALQLGRGLDIIESLVRHKASVVSGDVNGNTPLHVLLREGYNHHRDLVDIAKLLLGHGANPGAPNRAHVTPRRLFELQRERGAIPEDKATWLRSLLEV